MSHRRQEKEALRREREKREEEARAVRRRKQLVGYGSAAAIAIVAVVLVVALAGGGDAGGTQGGGDVFPEGGEVSEQTELDLDAAVEAAGCELKDTRSRGPRDREHVSTEQSVEYPDNPPTLGSHWPPGFQAEDGLYQEAPADEALVHTMEHGRVIVWVKPNLRQDARETLRALFDEDDYQMVMVPRRNMPYAVAATAWNGDPQPGGTGRTLGCDRWSAEVIDAIRTFRDEHRSNGPEPVP